MTVPPPGPHQGWGYGYRPPPPRGTNGLAVASLVCAFLFAPLGILFGHLSLAQIKRSGEDGHGIAVAGLIIGYLVTVLGVIVVVVAIVMASFAMRVFGGLTDWETSHPGPTGSAAAPTALPTFVAPATLGANCQYPATAEPASKPATPPRTGRVPTTPPTVSATLTTDQGDIGLLLDNATSPCTVNNFASLAQQGFYDGTPCHRLTTSAALGVLQCGDPTGTGRGGPGYRFPNEYPTNQYRMSDPQLTAPVIYPRGTLAMANVGPGTNGSQFYLVYADSALPPTYTVFGTLDDVGLRLLDDVAAAGVQDGSDDGTPARPVTIESARLDP